jgi:hypothetical protein
MKPNWPRSRAPIGRHDGERSATLAGHGGDVNSVAFSGDSKLVALGVGRQDGEDLGRHDRKKGVDARGPPRLGQVGSILGRLEKSLCISRINHLICTLSARWSSPVNLTVVLVSS